MDETLYNLELSTSTNIITIDGVRKNAPYYISDTDVDTSEWPKSFHLKATSEEGEVIYNHDDVKLAHKFTVTDEETETTTYWLEFRELSDAEIDNIRQDAAIAEADDNALAGLMATTDLYEDLLAKGVLD